MIKLTGKANHLFMFNAPLHYQLGKGEKKNFSEGRSENLTIMKINEIYQCLHAGLFVPSPPSFFFFFSTR